MQSCAEHKELQQHACLRWVVWCVAAPAAQAAFNCASGYFCLWADANGGGTLLSRGSATGTLYIPPYGATSGQSSRTKDTRLWAGGQGSGPSFCFKRGNVANFYSYPFPDGGTWDNRVSSYQNLTVNCAP